MRKKSLIALFVASFLSVQANRGGACCGDNCQCAENCCAENCGENGQCTCSSADCCEGAGCACEEGACCG